MEWRNHRSRSAGHTHLKRIVFVSEQCIDSTKLSSTPISIELHRIVSTTPVKKFDWLLRQNIRQRHCFRRSLLTRRSSEELQALVDGRPLSSMSIKLESPRIYLLTRSFSLTWPILISVPSIGHSSSQADQTTPTPTLTQTHAITQPEKTPELSVVLRADLSAEKYPVPKPIEHLASIQIEIAKFSRPITPTYRYSPFSFNNPLTKTDSLHSNPPGEIDEDSFFTDIMPEQIILPPHSPLPPISLIYSTTTEQRTTDVNPPSSLQQMPEKSQPTQTTRVSPEPKPKAETSLHSNAPESIDVSNSPVISQESPQHDHPVQNPATTVKHHDLADATGQNKVDQSSASTVPDKTLSKQSTPSSSLQDKTPVSPVIQPMKKSAPRPRQQRHHCATGSSTDSSKMRRLAFSVGDGLQWQDASLEWVSARISDYQ